jgi:Amt family ammonium transporter
VKQAKKQFKKMMHSKVNFWTWLCAASFFVLPQTVFAAELNQANTAWVLTSTALVLFMTIPGLLWLAGIYSLIFADGGESQAWIGSFAKAFLPDITTTNLIGDIPETVYFMFQMTFAIITPALIVGGFAERMKFSAMLWFSGLWLIFVYMPICHWIWGGGWLAKMGAMDFAGGIVIHVNAGVAA